MIQTQLISMSNAPAEEPAIEDQAVAVALLHSQEKPVKEVRIIDIHGNRSIHFVTFFIGCFAAICPSDCSGHGVCQDLRRFANDANEAASEASAGLTFAYKNAYDARKQFGCACDAGFRGPDCSQIECPSGKDPMGGYGADGRNSQVELTEDPNGPAMDCSGRGICDFSSGICQCFKGTC